MGVKCRELEGTAQTNTTNVFPVMEQCSKWLRLAWHLPSSDLFLSRKTRPKCVQWSARYMPLKQFVVSLSSCFLSENVTIFHLPSLATWLKEHLQDLLSWYRQSLPCLRAASVAVPGELEAGNALSSLLCPLVLSLSDVVFVKRPGQGIMYIFKEKHADNRVLATCVPLKWDLLRDTCHSNARMALPTSGHWAAMPGPLRRAGSDSHWQRPGPGVLRAALLSVQGQAASPMLLVREQGWKWGEKRRPTPKLFISATKVRAFPLPPRMGTGKLSSLMVQAHLSLAYK